MSPLARLLRGDERRGGDAGGFSQNVIPANGGAAPLAVTPALSRGPFLSLREKGVSSAGVAAASLIVPRFVASRQMPSAPRYASLNTRASPLAGMTVCERPQPAPRHKPPWSGLTRPSMPRPPRNSAVKARALRPSAFSLRGPRPALPWSLGPSPRRPWLRRRLRRGDRASPRRRVSPPSGALKSDSPGQTALFGKR